MTCCFLVRRSSYRAVIGNDELTIVWRTGRSQGSDRASIARSTKNAERPSISARPTHRHVHGPADRRKLQASNDTGLSGPAEAPDIPDRSRSEERRVGKECAVRVDHGGRRLIKKKKKKKQKPKRNT